MPEPLSIVAIALVKNEDLYLRRILANVCEFADRVIIADHSSRDNTGAIAQSLVEQSAKFEYHLVQRPSESHQLISGLAGTRTWVFGVDGDELYDPAGLAILKRQLLAGKYDSSWMLLGHALHCIALDDGQQTASGYMTPPCRSMTKLYNFSLISSWNGDCPERLHGGTPVYRAGHDASARRELFAEADWDKAIFRCLHLCFIPRSSRESRRGEPVMRPNIADNMARSLPRRLLDWGRRLAGRPGVSTLKQEKYMRGQLSHVSTTPFLGPLC